MLQVVHHCHVSGVVHRDIKPENFLLTSEKDDAALEACDFGLSAYFKPGQHFTQLIGSAYYVVRQRATCLGRGLCVLAPLVIVMAMCCVLCVGAVWDPP